MRLRAGVPVTGILEICRPFLLPGAPPDASLAAPAGIDALEPPESASPGALTFVASRIRLDTLAGLRAALILAEPATPPLPAGIPVIMVHSVHAALAALLRALAPQFQRQAPHASGPGNQVAPSALVEGCLEGGVTVGPGAYVGPGAFVGSGSRIGPNATVLEHCRLGRDCVVQSGAVIGCAGFGFHSGGASGILEAMPHPAGVEVGDGCWIGAQAVVAAGVLAPTWIGPGCKLDSHVQIAHNVRLGEGALLASQSGIAGSTVVGRRFRMGGNASVDGHLRIGDGVSVAACSGVTRDLPDGAVVAGFPARPIAAWRKQLIRLKGLG